MHLLTSSGQACLRVGIVRRASEFDDALLTYAANDRRFTATFTLENVVQ